MKRKSRKPLIASIVLTASMLSQSLLTALPVYADTTNTIPNGTGTSTITTNDNGDVTEVIDRDVNGKVTHHLTRTYGRNHRRLKEVIEDFDPLTGITVFETLQYDDSGRMISDEETREDRNHKRIGGYKIKKTYRDPKNYKGTETEHKTWKPDKREWVDAPLAMSNLSEVSGLVIAEVPTPQGNLRINFPNDLAAGDTITGTVLPEPKGKNNAELQANQSELNGYVVEVAGQKTNVSETIGKWLIPAAAVTAIALVVFDKQGNKVAEQSVPCLPVHPKRPQGIVTAMDYKLPRIGQTGKPLTIRGPFTGDAAGTSIKVGDSFSPILAESPRQAIAVSPQSVVGMTQIRLKEQGVEAQQSFRNIGCRLSIAKLPLNTGEKTSLSLIISGLEKLESPVKVKIINSSPGTVMLAGGDVQTVEIAPKEVSETGTTLRTFGVIGEHSGPFSITANLSMLGDEEPPISDTPAPGEELQKQGEGSEKQKEKPKKILDLPLGEPTAAEIKHDAEINAFLDRDKKKDELKTQEKKPGTKEEKEKKKKKEADDAQAKVDKTLAGMTPEEKKQLYKDLAESYHHMAMTMRKERDMALAKAKELREMADKQTGPGEKQKLNDMAEKQQHEGESIHQQLIQEDAHGDDYDKLAK